MSNRVVIRDIYGSIIVDRDMPTVPVIADTISGIDSPVFARRSGTVTKRDYNIGDREWELVVRPL